MSSVNEMTCSICLCSRSRSRGPGRAAVSQFLLFLWAHTHTHTNTHPDIRRRMRGPMKNQLTRRIIKNVEKEKRISKNATRLGLRSTDLQIYTQCNLLRCSSTHGACNTSLLHLWCISNANIKAAAAQCRAFADSDMDSCWPCCNYCCKRQSLWKVSPTEVN